LAERKLNGERRLALHGAAGVTGLRQAGFSTNDVLANLGVIYFALAVAVALGGVGFVVL
jgi:hypothetical protein